MTVITTAPEALGYAGNITNTGRGGDAYVVFQAGTHGNTWDAQILRYARRILASAGGGGGYLTIRNMPEPRAYIDPKYGPFPGILRLRECLAVTMANGVPTGYPFAQSTTSQWGLSGTQGGGAPGQPFVGFQINASWSANLAVPVLANVWRCVVMSDALVNIYDNATTISPLAPHEFEIVLDGTTNTIYWYIDSVLVGSYSPASGASPGQVTPYANAGGSAADRWNMAWNHGNVGSSGGAPGVFVTALLSRMSPFTPLLTYEYAD